MQPTEMAYRIGRAEAGITSAHTRADNHWELLMVLVRESKKGNGWRKLVPIAVYGGMTIFSALGITIPEKVAAAIKLLVQSIR